MTYTQRRMLRQRMMHRTVLIINIKYAATSILGFIPELIAGMGFICLFGVIAVLGAILG